MAGRNSLGWDKTHHVQRWAISPSHTLSMQSEKLIVTLSVLVDPNLHPAGLAELLSHSVHAMQTCIFKTYNFNHTSASFKSVQWSVHAPVC